VVTSVGGSSRSSKAEVKPPWTGQASDRHPVRFIAIRSHRQCDWPGLTLEIRHGRNSLGQLSSSWAATPLSWRRELLGRIFSSTTGSLERSASHHPWRSELLGRISSTSPSGNSLDRGYFAILAERWDLIWPGQSPIQGSPGCISTFVTEGTTGSDISISGALMSVHQL